MSLACWILQLKKLLCKWQENFFSYTANQMIDKLHVRISVVPCNLFLRNILEKRDKIFTTKEYFCIKF